MPRVPTVVRLIPRFSCVLHRFSVCCFHRCYSDSLPITCRTSSSTSTSGGCAKKLNFCPSRWSVKPIFDRFRWPSQPGTDWVSHLYAAGRTGIRQQFCLDLNKFFPLRNFKNNYLHIFHPGLWNLKFRKILKCDFEQFPTRQSGIAVVVNKHRPLSGGVENELASWSF